MVTLGADDELAVLRAYESGSDHHLAEHCGYLLLRAVLATITRRTLQTITSRHLHVGQIHSAGPIIVNKWGHGWAITTPH